MLLRMQCVIMILGAGSAITIDVLKFQLGEKCPNTEFFLVCIFPLISAIILFIKTWKIVFQTCFRATYGMDKIKIKHYVKLWNIMSDNCIFDDVLLRFFSSVRVSAKIPVSFYMF